MLKMFLNRYKFLFFVFIFLFSLNLLGKGFDYGIKLYSGGRYDNLRMCVASDAGVKGGFLADVMFLMRYSLDDSHFLTLNLPVMRPVLFGTAFKMLQFEPEITYETLFSVSGDTKFILGPSFGVSFHYGPDFNSSLKNRGPDFFAVGPLFSTLFAFSFNVFSKHTLIAGVRPFFVALFSKNKDLGIVAGGAFDLEFYF